MRMPPKKEQDKPNDPTAEQNASTDPTNVIAPVTGPVDTAQGGDGTDAGNVPTTATSTGTDPVVPTEPGAPEPQASATDGVSDNVASGTPEPNVVAPVQPSVEEAPLPDVVPVEKEADDHDPNVGESVSARVERGIDGGDPVPEPVEEVETESVDGFDYYDLSWQAVSPAINDVQVYCNDFGWRLDADFYENKVSVRVPVGTVLPTAFASQYGATKR